MSFTEGMQVYRLHDRTAIFTIHTVTKVYKNGNFLIDSEKQQYRPDGSQCGAVGYSTWLHPLTPEKHEELKANRAAKERQHAFRNIVDRLAHMSWDIPISEDQLKRIKALGIELIQAKFE